MAVGLALLVSADPVAIQQFSHALQELSITPDICREVPAAVGLLNRRKFDAVIVDLQLGDQSGLILDEVHLSTSNQTAVTFGIGDNDAAGTAAFRKKSQFVFERPLSAQSIHKTLKPAFGLILRERRRYFRYPVSMPVIIQRHSRQEIRCNGVNISGGDGVEHAGSAGSRRKRSGPVHSTRSRSTNVGRIDDLLVENGSSGSSLRIHF
jgi:ActR/RegA family two-component response regulator